MRVDMVQTSCGYAVPFMDNPRHRDTLDRWTDGKSDDDIAELVQRCAPRDAQVIELTGDRGAA